MIIYLTYFLLHSSSKKKKKKKKKTLDLGDEVGRTSGDKVGRKSGENVSFLLCPQNPQKIPKTLKPRT